MPTASVMRAPILSTAFSREERSCGGRIPGVMTIPLRSVILCVRVRSLSEWYCPAEVFNASENVCSLSTARPLILVVPPPFANAFSRGIMPAL